MRKRLPMTALITGLLAAPALGGAVAPSLVGPASPAAMQAMVETFPAEMPPEVAVRMRRWARGERLSAFGMQGLQAKIARAAGDRVAQAIAAINYQPLDVPFVYVQMNDPSPVRILADQPQMTLVTPTKTVTFLGVAPAPVPDALADQLHLSRGMGLMVTLIEAGSPAEKAGLQVNDLLQKLDDQMLINETQMQTLVHAKKPGDAVTFTLLRGGQTLEVKATLGEKQVAAVEMLPEHMPMGAAGANGHTDSVTHTFTGSSMTTNADGSVTRTHTDARGTITMNRDKDGKTILSVKDATGKALYEGPPEGAARALPADMARQAADLLNQPNEVRIEVTPGGPATPAAPGKVTIHTFTLDRDDGVHQISLRVDGTGRHLTVKEAAGGKVLYDGAVENPEDLLARGLPAAVVEKVKLVLDKIR